MWFRHLICVAFESSLRSICDVQPARGESVVNLGRHRVRSSTNLRTQVVTIPPKSASLCENSIECGYSSDHGGSSFLSFARMIPSLSYHLAPLCLDMRDQ